MADSPYIAALKMLARRELSEAQIRQRLSRRHYDLESIAAAVEQLKASRSIDDARVAGAIARSEAGIRHRGPRRVRQRLAAAGISGAMAERAVEEVFEQVDVESLLLAALEKRLAGRSTIADRREFGRLYRQLTAQGFDGDRVLKVLRAAGQAAREPDSTDGDA